MNKYLVEFIATAFFVYVILATGNPIAIGLALIIASSAALLILKTTLFNSFCKPIFFSLSKMVLASGGKGILTA